MGIKESLSRLKTALEGDVASLKEKGVEVPEGAKHSDVPDLIAQVKSGGGALPETFGIEKIEIYSDYRWDKSKGPTSNASRTYYPNENGEFDCEDIFNGHNGMAVHFTSGYDSNELSWGACEMESMMYGNNKGDYRPKLEIIESTKKSRVKYFNISGTVPNTEEVFPVFMFAHHGRFNLSPGTYTVWGYTPN